MELEPLQTTVSDLCVASLKECGAFGVGQSPLAEDINGAQARLQWMLQQWQFKSFLVYHIVNYTIVSTGAQFYTIGPGGDIDTGPGSVRPDKLRSAFLRQLISNEPTFIVGQTNEIDYPLEILQSRRDYDAIALKTLMSFPNKIWYDPQWPLGVLFPWPVPQASIYAVCVSVMEQLPTSFAPAPNGSPAVFSLPFQYYAAIVYNLALRLRSRYGIITPPGDELRGMARDALALIRDSNIQVPQLQMPADMNRPGVYNIFSDQFY